jgi:tryptophanyl-tRNA synthetase
MKADDSLIISIVDLHAITMPKEPKILKYLHLEISEYINKPFLICNIFVSRDYIYKCAATLIACGIDPAKTILYQQSQVS